MHAATFCRSLRILSKTSTPAILSLSVSLGTRGRSRLISQYFGIQHGVRKSAFLNRCFLCSSANGHFIFLNFVNDFLKIVLVPTCSLFESFFSMTLLTQDRIWNFFVFQVLRFDEKEGISKAREK